MIEIVNCKKKYDDTIVLKNINITVNRGDCIVLLGANGSGKTTLLKAILGVIVMDEGNITIEENHSIGFLLDDQLLYDELSIENNMKIYCPLARVKRSQRKDLIKRWLNFFGLYDYRKKKVKKISAGMKRRLSLALANLCDPDILIMDEPFNGLDSEFQEKFTNLVRDKIHDGAVAIISSHNIELLKPLANRWLNLIDGELSEQLEPGVAL